MFLQKIIDKIYNYKFDSDKGYKKYQLFGIKFNIYTNKYLIQKIQSEVKIIRNILQYSFDISNCPPAKGIARQHQLECLEIFKKIIEICSTNNLEYFISFGTCIGAVRHKSFIPWDDDIDITMQREDYLAIIPLLHQAFSGSNYDIREYLDNHFQVRIKRKDNSKIGVDIFPMDRYYQSSLSEDEVSALNNTIHKAIKKVKRLKHCQNLNKIRTKIKQVTDNDILNQHEPIKNSILFYAIDYPHKHDNLAFDNATIYPLIDVEFEGLKVKAPHNIDKYLRTLYGNYMGLPDKEYYG